MAEERDKCRHGLALGGKFWALRGKFYIIPPPLTPRWKVTMGIPNLDFLVGGIPSPPLAWPPIPGCLSCCRSSLFSPNSQSIALLPVPTGLACPKPVGNGVSKLRERRLLSGQFSSGKNPLLDSQSDTSREDAIGGRRPSSDGEGDLREWIGRPCTSNLARRLRICKIYLDVWIRPRPDEAKKTFFALLEWWSCITLNTTDNDSNEDEEEAKDMALVLTQHPNLHEDNLSNV